MSKVIIALSTSSEVVDIFEETLTGGYSCINTRLDFDLKHSDPGHFLKVSR